MAYLMTWPTGTLDGVLMNDAITGSGIELGGREVIALHLAIKERADAIDYTITAGDYSMAWDGTTVWLGDPEVDSGRLYLRDVLDGFHDAVVELVETGLFVEASASDTAWTETSLNTAIGLGDWADLLTRPADPRPFQWLHEALDRLIYVRLELTLPLASDGHYKAGGYWLTLQEAWTKMLADDHLEIAGFSSAPLQWSVTVNLGGTFEAFALIERQLPIDLSDYAGVAVGAAYQIARSNGSSVDVSYTIGGASDTAEDGVSDTVWITSSSEDLTVGASSDLVGEITTSPPATVPFAGAPASATLELLAAILYIDLESALSDKP